MTDIKIVSYTAAQRDAVLALAIRAWTPVFAKTAEEVPEYVYNAFYPKGWAVRQEADIASFLDAERDACWLALSGSDVAGFIGLRLHPEDQMGEVYILAVDPVHQRQGVARALLDFAHRHFRDAGMAIAMVETVADSGHAPAQRSYEAAGYERWPVARYFKRLEPADAKLNVR